MVGPDVVTIVRADVVIVVVLEVVFYSGGAFRSYIYKGEGVSGGYICNPGWLINEPFL